jgi:hypothetical protein
MKTLLFPLLATLVGFLRSRAVLHLEILALRQQLAMITNKNRQRIRFRLPERLFWFWLYRIWPGCLKTLALFKPDTLVPLAPARVQALLALSVAPREPWAAEDRSRTAGPDSSYVARESAVGRPQGSV